MSRGQLTSDLFFRMPISAVMSPLCWLSTEVNSWRWVSARLRPSTRMSTTSGSGPSFLTSQSTRAPASSLPSATAVKTVARAPLVAHPLHLELLAFVGLEALAIDGSHVIRELPDEGFLLLRRELLPVSAEHVLGHVRHVEILDQDRLQRHGARRIRRIRIAERRDCLTGNLIDEGGEIGRRESRNAEERGRSSRRHENGASVLHGRRQFASLTWGTPSVWAAFGVNITVGASEPSDGISLVMPLSRSSGSSPLRIASLRCWR